MKTFMERTAGLTFSVLLSLVVACGSPPSKTAEEGSPNAAGNAPGEGSTAGVATKLEAVPNTGPAAASSKTSKKKASDQLPKKGLNTPDASKSSERVKKIAREVATAIIAQNVERARKLFIPPAVLEQIFPGEACTKERASGEKERQRIERKLPGILRRGARFLIYGGDNLDGKVAPAQEAQVRLTLGDVEIRRSKTIPKGKTSKRGCTMNETIVGTKVRLKLLASMGSKTVDVPISIQVIEVGGKDWYLAEL